MASCSMATCGSRATAFKGAQLSGRRVTPVSKGVTAAVMRKQGIHPEWYSEAMVVCNGVEVMTVGGTKPTYNVDIYSGNHPFYQGVKTQLVVDEGQLNKFKKRFADAEDLNKVAPAGAKAVMIKEEKKPKGKGRK
mmetsp:Transcript_23412/g.51395  ORF Transcript_23412/g.51395 Transcript_23412/m.51395 type:complete len:135 (+) Transcript_23412:71-475(+)|eukprot:CAMPEP_0202899818 /NCGR_PEP_ID=MMETSP1392-20130828/8665_1 /ASSEMBLY_ACC=CAM_ASM_000868 /TAXON_ID=225041 /ORGANISM="Chlamydomonas chlamydogama, Strain SAG 11-48b" /LENGTH=134 /DNA_ID=CAMNT_0049586089 /DNA_START=71 /DNA_END=475 /DNA_ORIENTATION=+